MKAKHKINRVAVMSSVNWMKAAAVEKVLCKMVAGSVEIARDGFERRFYLNGVAIFNFMSESITRLSDEDSLMMCITNYFSELSTEDIILMGENPCAFTASKALAQSIRININVT
jgi:hypothetical protein